MRSKRKKEDIKHTALGWIAISGLIAWWVYEPEWETQGYESKAIYQQAVSGGFESRAQFEEAKSAGFSSLSAWNAHRESERVAAIEKAERERIAKVEAQRIAERTARELESPLWRRLDGVPKALRGFWEVSDGCGVQYLESMGVYLSFAHFLGENGWYIASYQKPASGSLAERSPAYSDPRKLRTVGVIPLESFHFKATDGAEYVLTAKNRPGGAYAVDRLYKISGEHVTQLWGHMETVSYTHLTLPTKRIV